MRQFHNVMVTGGAGFIGSNFIHYLFGKKEFFGNVINVDKLTYAGNLENLHEINESCGETRYFFEYADICDQMALEKIMQKYEIDCVINFAAESHVDRSILNPSGFIQTNIVGTFNLLEVSRRFWLAESGADSKKNYKDVLFHHVSTDEVFGSLEETGFFFEDTPYAPRNPYSASKASSSHLVNAYYKTYGLPITISNCSNNYGPYQFPEKMIPLMLLNMMEGKKLPIYGKGLNVRDWLYVEDHCSGIWDIITLGKLGETYNIGGENEITNLHLVHKLCKVLASLTDKHENSYMNLIDYVKDRPGHDKRYAINCDKIKITIGWKQSVTFDEGLFRTAKWYLSHSDWVARVKSGRYLKWIEKNYTSR